MTILNTNVVQRVLTAGASTNVQKLYSRMCQLTVLESLQIWTLHQTNIWTFTQEKLPSKMGCTGLPSERTNGDNDGLSWPRTWMDVRCSAWISLYIMNDIIYPISAKFGRRMVSPSWISHMHSSTNHSFGGDSSKTRDQVQASWLCHFQPDGSPINLS